MELACLDRHDDEEDTLQTDMASAPPLDLHSIERCPLADLPTGTVMGASLMCYSVDPTYGRIYFLLGKERKNAQWRAGSERWADFGGRTCSGAMSAEDTAAKEFLEETLGMVKFFNNDTLPRRSYADIGDALRAGDYTFKLTFGSGAPLVVNYVTYVRQLPWDPLAISRFEACREMLRTPERLPLGSHPAIFHGPNRSVHVVSDFMEKKILGLWSIPQLQNAVEHYGVLVRRNGRVERCRRTFVTIIELVLSEFAFLYPDALAER